MPGWAIVERKQLKTYGETLVLFRYLPQLFETSVDELLQDYEDHRRSEEYQKAVEMSQKRNEERRETEVPQTALIINSEREGRAVR